MSTHRPTTASHLAIEPRTPVSLLVPGKASNDFRRQCPVLERVRAVVAVPPRVEPRARDLVAAAERCDVEPFVLGDEVVDEGEDLGFRALQNRMAFFKRSCSSLSSAYFRSSRCS